MSVKTKRIEIKIVDLIIDEAYYPRFKESPKIIEAYAMAIDEKTGKTKLPPVKVAIDPDTGKHVLLDGYHRVSAHKRKGVKKVAAEVIKVPREDWMWVATGFNGKHGLALSSVEKEKRAKQFFFEGRELEAIAENLGITFRQVNRLIEDAREEKELYDMARVREARETIDPDTGKKTTLRKVAEATGIPKSTVKDWEARDWASRAERRDARAMSEAGQVSSVGQEGVMPSEPLGSRTSGTLAKRLAEQRAEAKKEPDCESFKGHDKSKEYAYDGCVGCSRLTGGLIGTALRLTCGAGHQMQAEWILRHR